MVWLEKKVEIEYMTMKECVEKDASRVLSIFLNTLERYRYLQRTYAGNRI
jgi:hypothetical protein